ncbi:MAG: tRNA lysidine(34) synthetase TilS [Oceanicoccus sp.]|uniref:tRNA lysidine(34) synthetase TilS n=2 Tax=Oceanicoccus sp. TaxID=2691044 RepID=UPI00261F1C2F|nr:tRNA lysidine(34) synthetase TilS [Oceanicoccus sp.]MDG1772201.1 tRNA lysidine(34) synthetase TilS [Oceanicoccus sp.]
MSFSSIELVKQLTPFLDAPRWLVAYSGGVDSHVLLHSLLQYPNHPPIEAVHINHQLQDEAGQWQQHCQQQADQLNIPLHTITVAVDTTGSLEEQARKARYQAFEALLEPGDVLLMGHHRDDQVETLMLRLLRGSGSRGLAAMPFSRPLGQGLLARPLLELPRSAIEQYAKEHAIQWVEDPSNQSTDFDRNFLRSDLLPTIASRWPAYRQTLARAASLSEESAELNDELALMDFEQASVSPLQPQLPIALLQSLSLLRQKNLLRFWFRVNDFSLPSTRQLQMVLAQALTAEQQAQPLISWGDVEVRRFKGALYVMHPLTEFDGQQTFCWDMQAPLQIAEDSCLSLELLYGEGINPDLVNSKDITVRFRQGGERCQPQGRGHSQSLKKLFQEYELAPWLRDRAPVLYCDDVMIAVAGLWVCEGWGVGPGEQGLAIEWLTD